MKKFSFLLIIILFLFGCSKKSDNSSAYSNSLQLGTGMNAATFQLIGVGTSFAAESTIYFRLESSDDMEGSEVKIQIDKQDGTPFNTFTFSNPQSYGHIFMSSFSIGDPGNYKATGILTKGTKTIASTNFTIYITK